MAISGTNLLPVINPVVVPLPGSSPAGGSGPAAATSDFVALPVTDLPFARLTLATLGLGLPRSQGDAAALFAQVSLALEQTIGDARDNKLSGYAAALATNLAVLAAQIVRIADDKKTVNAADAQIAALNTQRDPLVAARDSAQASSNGLAIKIGTDEQNVATTLKALNDGPQSGTTYAANLNAYNQAKQTLSDDKASKAAFDKIVIDKNAEIAPLDAKISTQNGIKNAAEADIVTANSVVQATLDLISRFLAGIPPSTRLTEQARDTVIVRQFEDIFQNLRDSSSRADADKEIQTLAEQLGVKQSVVQKILLAAFGLTAGIGDLVNSIRQLQPSPESGLPDQASVVNGRLQFAV